MEIILEVRIEDQRKLSQPEVEKVEKINFRDNAHVGIVLFLDR